MKQVQTVTLRSDDPEEMQALNALIQHWVMNGWTVKNISQFSRQEGQLPLMSSGYSTITFEKEDTTLCPICNAAVGDMKLHGEWHTKKAQGPEQHSRL